MRKSLLFIVAFAYAFLSKAVANSIIDLSIELRFTNLFQPGSLLLAIGETLVIMHIALRRCDESSSAFSQFHASIEWWIKGVILLVVMEFVVAIFVGGISPSMLAATWELLWENVRLYALMMAPVAIWGGQLALRFWKPKSHVYSPPM